MRHALTRLISDCKRRDKSRRERERERERGRESDGGCGSASSLLTQLFAQRDDHRFLRRLSPTLGSDCECTQRVGSSHSLACSLSFAHQTDPAAGVRISGFAGTGNHVDNCKDGSRLRVQEVRHRGKEGDARQGINQEGLSGEQLVSKDSSA